MSVENKIRIHNRKIDSANGITREAFQFFIGHSVTLKSGLDYSTFARHKADQASWFLALASAKRKDILQMGFRDKNEYYSSAISIMMEDASHHKWRSWKCNSILSLRKRLRPFQQYLKGSFTIQEACESLVSKKFGNQNSLRKQTSQQ